MEDGEADEPCELFQRTHDDDAMRKRTGRGDIKVVAPGLSAEGRRAVSRDAPAKRPGMDHALRVEFRCRIDIASPCPVDHQLHRFLASEMTPTRSQPLAGQAPSARSATLRPRVRS